MTKQDKIAGKGRNLRVLLPLALPEAYTYRCPPHIDAEPGDFVQVPLGPRQMAGVVWAVAGDDLPDAKLRDVSGRFDAAPMSALQRRFIDWIADYTLSPPGAVLRMAMRVPEALGPPRARTGVRLTGREPERMTPQRRRVLDMAVSLAVWPPAELAREAGVSPGVVHGLVGTGALAEAPLPAFAPFEEPRTDASDVTLSDLQQDAAAEMTRLVASGGYSVTVLDGVTGSGKTEVYLEALSAALARGAQTLVLLPEIALTGQFLDRFERRFGVRPAEWHSAIRSRERERVWRGVADGSARIVVGARSALFLPFSDLGLIVVDEEHDPAFKQEDGVTYHARDMAVVRAALGKIPAILSSATPSLETLHNVERGRYGCVELDRRHGGATMPVVSAIDMRSEGPERGKWLAPRMREAVAQTLGAGEQVLLFLNRRGYAPLTLCRTCGHRLQCPNCDTWLVEHRFRRHLLCHHCGHQADVPGSCPECGTADSLVACGPGVERLAEEVADTFPDARVTILSSDLLRGEALRDTLTAIAEGEYDLVIGTQLVAKGHNFPQLTLVGVADADISLGTGDPRAAERTYQLLRQVAGRAGRGDRPGRALLQTYQPDHPLMEALISGDRDRFYDCETRAREQAGLPPYGRLAAMVVSAADAADAMRYAEMLARTAPQTTGVRVLGPAPAPIALLRGRHRVRLLIKSVRDFNIQDYIRTWLGEAARPRGSVRLAIDIDPQSFM